MNPLRFQRIGIAALLFASVLAYGEVHAKVDMSGAFSYRLLEGDQVVLEVDRIENRGTKTTDTLYLTLWMTDTADPYTTGYVAARTSLAQLPGGGKLAADQHYANISVTTNFTSPHAGTYYVHLYVSEASDLGGVLDLGTFTQTETFYKETVDFVDGVNYSINGNRVTLEVDRIENNRATETGTLYLTLWMTQGPDPFTSGYKTARASLVNHQNRGRLASGDSFSNVSLTTEYSPPPPGTYHVHVILAEYPHLSTSLDARTFSETIMIEEPPGSVAMRGARYRLGDDEVEFEIGRITNDSTSAAGPLHLTLLLTSTAEPSGTGHRAARIALKDDDWDGTLDVDDSVDNLRRKTQYVEPRKGTYHVHLYLSESSDINNWLSLVTFNNRITVGGDDHGDEPDSATDLTLAQAVSGRLERGGDTDVFRVVLQRPGRLRVQTTGATDTHGTLRTSDTDALAVDDDGGDGINFLIEQQVPAGTYYVSVRGYDFATTGAYSLEAHFEASPERVEIARISVDRHLGDFNGDGKADVLLRNTDGHWYYYPMDGKSFVEGQQGDSNLPQNPMLELAGIGDFDGDGKDDVLLRHADGSWYFYPMTGANFIANRQGVAELPLDLEYRIAGIGDFNGDGKDDVLLRHGDGSWRYMPMNGKNLIAAEAGPANLTSNLGFRMAGIADFNADGKDDVLLRHEDGRWYLYIMDGRRFVLGSGPAKLSLDPNDTIAGVADFDGDGKADVLLRKTDGSWDYYAMDGRHTIAQKSGAANLDSSFAYSVHGIGDLDGDGKADVLLRHSDGHWLYQPMNGNQIRLGQGTANIRRELDWALPVQGQPSRFRTGKVTGIIAVTQGMVLDGDTFEALDDRQENGTPQDAQWVLLPATIAGVADAEKDTLDVYRIAFPAAARMSLAIADADGADLDLYLAEPDGTILAQSLGTDQLEEIQTTLEGEHLIIVSAFSGMSNYSLLATLMDTGSASSGATAHSWSRDGEFVPGQLLVKQAAKPEFEQPDGRLQLKRSAQSFPFQEIDRPPSGITLVKVDPGSDFAADIEPLTSAGFRFGTPALRQKAATLMQRKHLRSNTAFEYVQPNYLYEASAVPNDPYNDLQWHYANIGLPRAWDLTTGSDDIVIAVVDTGVITEHPDLGPRLLRDANKRIVGYDFIRDPLVARDGDGRDSNPYDDGDRGSGSASSFHGTHVAGTIAAATNNDQGVSGVTWNGKIMPLRVLGRGGGTWADIAEAILYAAKLPNASNTLPPRRADVINLSLGPKTEGCMPSPTSPSVADALQRALAAGVIVVVAAGNEDCRFANPMGRVAGVVSVGATNLRGSRAAYSNYGDDLHVVAPGGELTTDVNGDGSPDGILSTLADDSTGAAEITYGFANGTSMAAPHVAGVAALMRSVNPKLTPTDFNKLLAGTHGDPAAAPITRDIGLSGRDSEFGYGLIDAYHAVRVAKAIAAGNDSEPSEPVLAASPSSLHFGATANLLRARLSNVGGGQLYPQSVTSNQAWLEVSIDEWPTLVARVERAGLSAGAHVGFINIVSNGGKLNMRVTLQVWDAPNPANLGTIHVYLVDPQTSEIKRQTSTNLQRNYGFEISDVSPGNYHVVAGTDRDGDLYFCDAGEACGTWPVKGNPEKIQVDGDQNLKFTVSMDLFARLASQSHLLETTGAKGLPLSESARGE